MKAVRTSWQGMKTKLCNTMTITITFYRLTDPSLQQNWST